MPARHPESPTPIRANLPIRTYLPGQEPGDDLSATTSPEERIALVWELSRRMWDLTGRPMPDAARSGLPIRVIRPA